MNGYNHLYQAMISRLIIFTILLSTLIPISGAEAEQGRQTSLAAPTPKIKETLIKVTPPQESIYIFSEKKMSPVKLERLTRESGVATLGRNGVLVIDHPAGVAKSRGWEYEYKGHIIYPPEYESYDLYNCYPVSEPPTPPTGGTPDVP